MTPRRPLPRAVTVLAAVLGLATVQLAAGRAAPAAAASQLTVSVGYMDTHSAARSSRQPSPWPYTNSSEFIGSPCASFGTATNCWDAAAVMLSNTGGTAVSHVLVKVVVTTHTYELWGTSLTVKAHSILVLTETGKQNSENFDLSDFPPNAYNGGGPASCKNDGAIPKVKVTVGGTTTTYRDTGQVMNTHGADGGHCQNGAYMSKRVDESHPWVKI
jgi:hypothetical protein